MTEPKNNELEIAGQVVAPRLSDESLAGYNRLLSDQAFARDYPAEHATLKASLDNALAFTGQTLDPPPDGRSAAQRQHDRWLGVEPRTASQYQGLPEDFRQLAASMSLPSDLASVISNDLSTNEALTAEQGARIFGADRYAEMLKQAQQALDRAPSTKVKSTDLPSWSLGQLSAWGERLRKHAEGRPQ